jgi:hypothetical protein
MHSGRPQRTGRVKVYRFRLYDIASEDFRISARMATPACIKRIGAEIIKRTELEIDRRYLNSDGMTEIGFVDPEATRTYLASPRRTCQPSDVRPTSAKSPCSAATHSLVPFGDWLRLRLLASGQPRSNLMNRFLL